MMLPTATKIAILKVKVKEVLSEINYREKEKWQNRAPFTVGAKHVTRKRELNNKLKKLIFNTNAK